MANKMLIDATHPEETRVVVVRGNRVEEFDYESASRKQLRGNIYLAKVTRVEPSLQAAFIEYGGNRHGFLAFSEIHPDYYQIPVADRLALIEEEERAARLADDEAEVREKRRERGRSRRASADASVSEEAAAEDASAPEAEEEVAPAEVEPIDFASVDSEVLEGEVPPAAANDDEETVASADGEAAEDEATAEEPAAEEEAAASEAAPVEAEPVEVAPVEAAPVEAAPVEPHDAVTELLAPAEAAEEERAEAEAAADALLGSPLPAPVQQMPHEEAELRHEAEEGEVQPTPILPEDEEAPVEARAPAEEEEEDEDSDVDQIDEEEEIEHLGSDEDALEEVPERSHQRRARTYKIQEVIRRRQVMLVQVVKEERGNKGAALTTYLSLAGRYSVLMPNTARGGGISRKITNAADRKRLKEVVQDLEVPEGMGIILRTAGANRTKTEIKRDFEYLLRLWETVRELTLSSAAPSLVYEEGSLIKRAIRDLYNKDIDEILVAGEEGYKEAKDFMRMLMPSHAKAVQAYRDPQPIYARFGVEQQLDAMFSPVVQLKSGGYIVIDPTEALVSIDVNSGRATREHHIEDTALKTNLEAAEEIARQLRLRDLAGLIVIDFIDMEEKRNNRAVERKLKDCLKNDRARIQIGRISHFGLLEMSRQRIRTGVLESSIEVCPHCGGTGHVRSAASVSLQLLRAFEEQLLRSATNNLVARTRTEVALYVLNQKRAHLRELEERFSVTLSINADDSVTGHQPFIIEKGELAVPPPVTVRAAPVVHPDSILPDEDYPEEAEEILEEEAEGESEATEEAAENEEAKSRRRRRRRRRRPDEQDEAAAEGEAAEEAAEGEEEAGEEASAEGEGEEEANERRRRRRGRRGGRRNRRDREGDETQLEGEEPSVAEAAEGEAAEGVSEAEAASAEGEPKLVPTAEAETAPEVKAEVAAEIASPAETEGEVPASKPRRRRSTVREKAPVVVTEDGAVQMAAPEAVPAESAEAAVPAEVAGAPTSEMPEAPEAAAPAGEQAAAEEAPAEEPAVEEIPAKETPAEEPVAEEASSKPRRTGWWQRKLFGD